MESRQRKRAVLCTFVGLAVGVVAGCAAQQKTTKAPSGVPARLLSATKQQLVTSYNEQAESIHSVNASVSIKLTAGTSYSGVIKRYHEISGFILARKPADIRVIGQAPVVGTTIFDMVSNGSTFRMYIPSKNTFLEGATNLQRESAKPIENLRPQHLVEAIFWNPISQNEPILFAAGDEAEARYYTLTVVAGAANAGNASTADWRIERRIWFDRVDLRVARVQIYAAAGDIASDIRYAAWHRFGNVRFPENLVIARPAEDYELQLEIKKLTANEAVPPERFELKRPPGTKVVHVSEATKEPN